MSDRVRLEHEVRFMTNEPPNFEEFIDSLHDAGWRGINDAQHEYIHAVYAVWKQRLHNCEVACEYWRLLAEKKPNR